MQKALFNCVQWLAELHIYDISTMKCKCIQSCQLFEVFYCVQAAVMSIAFKEGLRVPPPAVNEIIVASNQDIRQVISLYSLILVRL